MRDLIELKAEPIRKYALRPQIRRFVATRGWAKLNWIKTSHPPRDASANSFHEKAGMSQEGFSLFVFSFLPVDSSHSCRSASCANLPSALLFERISLGAWWAFPNVEIEGEYQFEKRMFGSSP